MHIIRNYLQNRSHSAVLGSYFSSQRKQKFPQDSLVEPTHFNCYIKDIPSTENDNNIAVAMCADDECQCSIR
jgi:hypothetical protein